MTRTSERTRTAHGERQVFVDDSGRRHRLTGRLGLAGAGLMAAYLLGVAGLVLGDGPSFPFLPFAPHPHPTSPATHAPRAAAPAPSAAPADRPRDEATNGPGRVSRDASTGRARSATDVTGSADRQVVAAGTGAVVPSAAPTAPVTAPPTSTPTTTPPTTTPPTTGTTTPPAPTTAAPATTHPNAREGGTPPGQLTRPTHARPSSTP